MRQGKKHSPEEIVNLLRQVEVDFANSKTLPQACKEDEIVETPVDEPDDDLRNLRAMQSLVKQTAKRSR
jgi:hypothetical protein